MTDNGLPLYGIPSLAGQRAYEMSLVRNHGAAELRQMLDCESIDPDTREFLERWLGDFAYCAYCKVLLPTADLMTSELLHKPICTDDAACEARIHSRYHGPRYASPECAACVAEHTVPFEDIF